MAISSQRSSDSSRGYSLYLIPGTIGFILIVLIPQLANLGLSFTAWKGVGTPRPVGLQNYHRLLTDDQFWGSMYHTLLFIVSMTVIPVCIGLVLAALLFDYVRDEFGEWVSSFFRAGFYLPQILPVTVAGVLWGWILNPVGVINITLKAIGLENLAQNWIGDATYALAAVSLVIVWIQVGYCLVVFMAGLSRIDPSLYEAAELDGANWWSRLVTITIPLLAPEIFVVVLTTLIAALKVFAPIFVITAGGPDNATLVPSYLTYYHFFTTQRVGYAAAIAVVQTTLTIALAVIFLRFQSQQESKE
ncbi:carbohydrate ABC transporter permease (plasmid) [Rhizobium leguminosarum]|jgi:raffinose/stachyose/melibiose transport system permease protein|uniref:carbohydrate ABC transporter permease n=1 Tax=Rhizobium TaxID=379 RepID=UPI0010393A2D|nr:MULTISPECIES: sugar ABC transporter permease [Rhizobium]MCJ9693715.1 sugar ABC transporter permease [Rhizobium sp. PRIMUS64]MDV4164804.1 sugar ABC transporter permease [Rhizobium leguminosarum]MDV4175392.1 sugar ABC transporter permease [Rhizobium leguminosarum]NKJ94375.1 ABC transporter permease subunit [Rhizobium leguminosarum bv. viciae]NKK45642.1 ABC transporter permease subunit [Rhizobium leguminosarum bv. viciae]